MMNRIKSWPKADRPRERLLSQGPEPLSDAELLALILRTGNAADGTTAVDQARSLITCFGDLRALSGATTAELCQQSGIGPAKAAEIQALFELARRFACSEIKPGTSLTSSQEVFAHFHERLRNRKKEVFISILLDSKNRLLREIQVSEGSLNASIVHPREVFAPVIRESAAAVLFVHNHPSGDPEPSREDIELTKRLREAGQLMGVRVLDHIIIGNGRYTSFCDSGLFT
jgi:DNA repair protein RadC